MEIRSLKNLSISNLILIILNNEANKEKELFNKNALKLNLGRELNI